MRLSSKPYDLDTAVDSGSSRTLRHDLAPFVVKPERFPLCEGTALGNIEVSFGGDGEYVVPAAQWEGQPESVRVLFASLEALSQKYFHEPLFDRGAKGGAGEPKAP